MEKDYFAGDDLAWSVWKSKYATIGETTPQEMHFRLAASLANAERSEEDRSRSSLSKFGQELMKKFQSESHVGEFYYSYLDRFKWIIPQGSIMSMLGTGTIGSLSNCFVIPSPIDSYGGIFETDQQVAQIEKRRGGVGLNLNSLRPENTPVLNAAKTSTGAHSFMDRYSNTTREVAQNGRRGALMLLMSVAHPDIFKFVRKKKDRSKVTGANISVQLTDEFMRAVESDSTFTCRFPVDTKSTAKLPTNAFNTLYAGFDPGTYFMLIKAKELYQEIVENAWDNAEPGIAFMDNVVNYSPEGVYPQYRPVASNPCGEQWLQAYDACRLLAMNFFSCVKNPYTQDAELDLKKVYEVAYVQQRMADVIVDLEISHVQKIIEKIKADPEPEELKASELRLWENVKRVASSSRRTGCGFTGLADMLAALNVKYDSNEALKIIDLVMREKFKGEWDCSIDLGILRGTFTGWDPSKESTGNAFYEMMEKEFPELYLRNQKYGRRNVSLSTVAPTGSLSIITILEKYCNISAGIEPQFACWYMRNKKVNPGDEGVRIDFTDQNGDSWMTYPVVMGGFKEWIEKNHKAADYVGVELLPEDVLKKLFEKSPYYKACANDIDWKRRIEIQALVQKYTTNAISSTLNLSKETTKETVSDIYMYAWKKGLKGVTVYRDGSRTGVLVTEKKQDFEYSNAAKRPKELNSELHLVSVKGVKYGVIIGLMNNKPYEVFGFTADPNTKAGKGKIVKVKRGHYNFISDIGELTDIQSATIKHDELVLTRLISGMLRHGAKPQYVMEQIEKCELEVVSFGKAISRTLKKYCSEEEMIERSKCSNCGSTDLKMQEGCLTCNSCGFSKCG